MSSAYVRTQMKDFITTNFLTEKLVDLTAQYLELKDVLSANSLTYASAWLGIDFVGADEIPIAVTTDSSKGCYRETGSIYFHIVEPAKTQSAGNIISRGETLRSGLRGQRIGDIIIEGVTPTSTEGGTTLQFEGGFTSGSFFVNYYRDLNL